MMRVLLAAVCFSACLAAPAWPEPQATEQSAEAHYAGYVRGLHLFNIDIALLLHPADYRLRASFELTGVLGAVVHADGSAVVDGRFIGDQAAPRELFSTGEFRGAPHVTQIDWRDGAPKIVQMVPPPEPQREPVPPADQAHTVDVLSAIAVLLHQVTQAGRCETATRTFDGARLSEFTAHTVGEETLPPTDRSSFQGPALRCDVTGRMLGGFMREGDTPAAHKPKHGAAWLARLHPGGPMLPVRIVFFTDDGSPSATLYLAPLLPRSE